MILFVGTSRILRKDKANFFVDPIAVIRVKNFNDASETEFNLGNV